MLCPTNSEWNRLVAEYEPYFNYPGSVAKRDSMVYANTRMAIIRGAFFSRTFNTDAALLDSAVSTQAPSALVRQMLDETGCQADVEKITLARELWQVIPQEKIEDFCHVVLKHCLQHCSPLVPKARLTLLLIDDDGTIHSL